MRSRARGFVWAMLLVMAVVWVGCGEGGEKVNEAAETEYAGLIEDQSALADLRAELAALRAEAEAAAEAAADEGESEQEEGEETEAEGEPSLEERITTLENGVSEASEAFNKRIADYFNLVDPMLEGDPPNEKQAAILRMKSAEDMVIAAEYIERGGDYRRAIRIYQDALGLDPDNEQLQAALARAEEMRFMTPERLDQIRNDMTRDEVRAILGPVNLRNVRDYPERNVIAWFYPVDDSGAASAVWFRKNRAGKLVVYKKEFEQIKGREEGEPAEGE